MKVKSVQRLDPDIKVIPKGVTPLITKSGVLIGAYYLPSKVCEMTPEDEFWQAVLLGIEGEFSPRRIARMLAYSCFLLALMFTTYWKVKEVA